MIRIDIADAKVRLSRLLARVERGERFLVCRRNEPVAELRPVPVRRTVPRPVGVDRGLSVPDSFFDPLPDEVLDAFQGRVPRR